ncbi:MAG: zinc ABC transporter substrate-binding protein [Chloroflexi bacterium]|nr:zinc ABC transporter substrate-binding protein [Chloroflexota bacterium]
MFRLLAMMALGLLVAACGSPRPADMQPGRLKVATSITPLADMIERVGGDRVEVVALVPRGARPEDYAPTPANVAVVSTAKVFFANGFGLEDYLTSTIESAGNDQIAVVRLSEGLPVLSSFGGGSGNPHLWLNPRNGIAYVEVIRQTLGRIDPAGSGVYDTNAAAYTAELQALDAALEQQVAQIPPANRYLVSMHDAYPYYAERFGLKYLAIVSANPGADPSAQDYAALVQVVRDNHVRAVFGEAGFSDRFIRQLAADTGATYVAGLYTDSLSQGPPADTYAHLLQATTDAVVRALK